MHEAFWNGLFDVRWKEASLGPEAIRLVQRLRERGYAERTCRDYGHAVIHLGRYLHEELESDRGSKTSEPPKVMLSPVQSAILLTPADPDSQTHDKEGHRPRSHNPQLHVIGVLPGHPEDQGLDVAAGGRPAGLAADGPGGPAAADDVAVPAHDRIRGYQQPQPVVAHLRYHGEQGREQCPSSQSKSERRGCRRCKTASWWRRSTISAVFHVSLC
jgi:hypothetical protein